MEMIPNCQVELGYNKNIILELGSQLLATIVTKLKEGFPMHKGPATAGSGVDQMYATLPPVCKDKIKFM